MAYTPRPTSMLPGGGASLRQSSNQPGISQQQSSALTTRIASKKAELENMRQLRDLSAMLATQMQTLETKIGTLNDGTEGSFIPGRFLVLCVSMNGTTDLGTWFPHQRLRAFLRTGTMSCGPSVWRQVSFCFIPSHCAANRLRGFFC